MAELQLHTIYAAFSVKSVKNYNCHD